MDRRKQLHDILKSIIGSNNVYFQPPESVKMTYPCIVYSREDIFDKHANDYNYIGMVRYKLTVISYDPDLPYYKNIVDTFPHCSYEQHFATSSLNHDVYTLYF